MAGINLAGAVGMTGKRESIFSDLPQIIQHTGDNIAKSIADSKERKEKANLLKQQKDLAAQAALEDQWGKFVVERKSDLDPRLSAGFHEEIRPLALQQMATFSNPTLTEAQKKRSMWEAMSKIDETHNIYKSDEEDFAKHIKLDDTHDKSEAQRFLAGVDNVKIETKDALANDQTAPYKANIPMEEAQTKEVTETTGQVKPQYFDLRSDERRKEAPSGLGDKLGSLTRLLPLSEHEVFNKVIPTVTWDAAVETDANGNFKVNEKTKQDAVNNFRYSVTEGTNKEARVLKKAIESEAYNRIMQDTPNATHDEINEKVKTYTEHRVNEIANNQAELNIQAKINDASRARAGREKETPTIGTPFFNRDKTTDYNTAKETSVQILSDKGVAAAMNEIAKTDPTIVRPTKGGGYEVLDFDKAIVMADDPAIKEKLTEAKEAHDNTVKLAKYDLLHTYGQVDTNLKGGKKTYHTLDGDYIGTPERTKEWIGKDGKRQLGLIISTNDEKGKVIERIALLENADNMAKFQEDSNGTADKFIDAARKKTDELLASQKKAVPSQGGKDGVKAPKKEYKATDVTETFVKGLKDNEIVIIDGIERIKQDGKLKKVKR